MLPNRPLAPYYKEFLTSIQREPPGPRPLRQAMDIVGYCPRLTFSLSTFPLQFNIHGRLIFNVPRFLGSTPRTGPHTEVEN